MATDSSQHAGATGLGPGTVLDGKYEILSRIGMGGMGEVFKARHLHLNTFRCIKVMKQGLLADEIYRARFLREARLATQIHHPNVAVVHDFFIGDRGNFMVTEFIDGTTLRQWATAHGPFPAPVAADVMSQVLSGLEYIHRRGLLHRDISPDNVMLSYDSDERLVAKIIDLGIAKDTNTAPADATQAGVLIGNPKYMSPEQLGMLADGEQLDGRADLYCLGAVLYEMLLGVSPFASETPQGYIMKHLTQLPARFAAARPDNDLPQELEEVVFRTLEKDRKRRFADAHALLVALEPFLVAQVGMLDRAAVTLLRRGPEKTVEEPLPAAVTVAENDASSTEMRARAFELELLDDVHQREVAEDREGLQRLGEAHPRGTLVGDAAREALHRLHEAARREREEEALFQSAWEDGRAVVLRSYIDEHPDSPRAEQARKLLEEAVAFESLGSADSETAVRQFLVGWPDGRHHLEAEIRLSAMRQRAAEEREAAAARLVEPHDFDEAWEKGTTGSWDRFLAAHPASERLAEARKCRQEAADFEQAVAADLPAMWRAFLKSWPEGRHRMDAALRVKR
jgi:tRNA A-37 threonylcarbamoyl transferase component Bud32